jgi:hypothetical protein
MRGHAMEIQETAEHHRQVRAEIEERSRPFEAYDRTVRPDRGPARLQLAARGKL